MAAPKRPTHVVVHPKMSMAVNGKLQRLEVGAPLTLTAAQAEKLGARVKEINSKEAIDLTGAKSSD